MEKTQYPLAWPLGWPRTTLRHQARFSSNGDRLTISDGLRRLNGELSRLGVYRLSVVISSNLVLGQRGMPLANQAEPRDPGVAVYFNLKGKDRVLACDRWQRVSENLAAIAAHIDAIRRVDRYGVGTMDQAFAGYTALPPSAAYNNDHWRKVLGMTGESVSEQTVQSRWKDMMKKIIVDAGLNGVKPDENTIKRLNVARDQALADLRGGV